MSRIDNRRRAFQQQLAEWVELPEGAGDPRNQWHPLIWEGHGHGSGEHAEGVETVSDDKNLFKEWSNLNGIIADFRCRFDVLREELPKCRTRAEAQALINAEGFGQRYPHLPDWLT